ncbi:hypothetical protein FIBSPDRAFT_1052319 [Athelia psychrophila]|uniref:Uncharacterized protein n=1 Tax=Athelia psychrophila TaxID=1759441 RepID=A0A165XIM1_9AGAM|nr:hypothetical protein FIBSPDRAFT_1052319 [Fibularhizoctonia sp. CBS 109695]
MASPKNPTSRKPAPHPQVANTRRSAARATPRASVGLKVKRAVRAGKSKPVKAAGKHGPRDHFQGAEKEYLLSRLPDYQAAVKNGKPGLMCLSIGRDLVHKFGDVAFHLKATEGDAEDADSDEDAGADADAEVVDDDDELEAMGVGSETNPQTLTQAAADLHASRLQVLSKKLSQWFRRVLKAQNSVLAPTIAAASEADNPYASLLSINTVPPPCRKSIGSYYMHEFYASRVRHEYDQVYAKCCEEWDAAVRRNETPKGESAEFMADLQARNDSEFDVRMQTWRDGKTAPTTPQQYHNQLQSAAAHVLPVAETIAKLMGAIVTIFIVGPIPDKNGVIENRSISVNHPGGTSGKTWAEFDPMGFKRPEDSFIQYRIANYTQEECRRRVLSDDCQIMVEKRAARESIHGVDDLLKMDVATSEHAPPLFFLSPISESDPHAALQSPLFSPSPIADPLRLSTGSQHLLPPSPIAGPVSSSADFQQEALSALDRSLNGRPPISPLRSVSNMDEPMLFAQSQLLQSAPASTEPPLSPIPQPVRPLTRRPRRSTDTQAREQKDELPLLDQGWSISRKTPRKFGERSQSRPALTYRVNRAYDTADDIYAGMRDEEEEAAVDLSISAGRSNGALGMSPNITYSPSPGRPSAQRFPFTFNAPSRCLFPPLSLSRPAATYAGRKRTIMSSPIRNLTYETPTSKRQRSGVSHSSPSYGRDRNALADADKHPSLASFLICDPSNHSLTPQSPIRAQKVAPLSLSWPTASPIPVSSPLPSSPPTASSPLAQQAAPNHWSSLLVNTYDYAVADSHTWGGGKEWIDLVTMVMEFLAPLTENGKYPAVTGPELTMVRPPEVLSWQNKNRPFEDMHIANLPIFITLWWAWWSLMQPPSRIAADTSVLAESSYAMDWSPLRQPGQNGLALVVMTLRWWGVQSNASREWQEAFADVTSAILCMTDSLGDSAVKQGTKPNAFKDLLAPEGPYAYDTSTTKRKRSGTQVTTSKPRNQRRVVSTMPATSTSQASATQRRVSAPIGRKANPIPKPKSAKHSWSWAPTTSSPQAGGDQADDNEMLEILPRETRAHKRKRVEQHE